MDWKPCVLKPQPPVQYRYTTLPKDDVTALVDGIVVKIPAEALPDLILVEVQDGSSPEVMTPEAFAARFDA